MYVCASVRVVCISLAPCVVRKPTRQTWMRSRPMGATTARTIWIGLEGQLTTMMTCQALAMKPLVEKAKRKSQTLRSTATLSMTRSSPRVPAMWPVMAASQSLHLTCLRRRPLTCLRRRRAQLPHRHRQPHPRHAHHFQAHHSEPRLPGRVGPSVQRCRQLFLCTSSLGAKSRCTPRGTS